MRVVAAQTSLVFVQGFMLEFNLIDPVTDVLMTFDTEHIAGFIENKSVI